MAERFPSLRPRELLRVLERAGFSVSRQTGSHLILFKEGHPKPVSIPRHNREMKRGLVAGILADAGVTRREFLRLLRES
ncbi:MAG: type II toxin-antitoxin system HicA family toxin [Chloroflexi bacterium]|nr:type II toxin-antitoxin system HicA family toxin [Chloroflexota bacterium]